MTSKAQRSRGMPKRRTEVAAAPNRTPLFIIGGLVAMGLVAAIVAVVLSTQGPGISQPATTVQVSGESLPLLTAGATDPAVGMEIPTLSGTGIDGEPVTISPSDGPMAIVVLAHWCPHCQVEVPVLVDWMAANEIPAGVEVVGLTTSIDPARPNYPPVTWLEREGWTQPTLIDNASSTALQALGLNNFPGYVLVGADGTVQARLTGEIGGDQFGQLLAALAE